MNKNLELTFGPPCRTIIWPTCVDRNTRSVSKTEHKLIEIRNLVENYFRTYVMHTCSFSLVIFDYLYFTR